MARQWHDFDQSYHCARINRTTAITTRVVTLPNGDEVNYPMTCSGFSTCRLFPRMYFPEAKVLRAPTGCPFLDSLRIERPRWPVTPS